MTSPTMRRLHSLFDDWSPDSTRSTVRVDELSTSTASLAKSTVSAGYCVGAALATVLSWEANHALGCASIQVFLSWIYVVYYAVTRWTATKMF